MYYIDINKFLIRLKSFRKNVFLKYIDSTKKNKIKNKESIKDMENKINKIVYTEDFFKNLKEIYRQKEL